jgi:hypothetical protein
MLKAALILAVFFVLVHWLTAGADDIINPSPTFPTNNLEVQK